jgi:hypothetical protein
LNTSLRRVGLVVPCAWLVACTVQSSSPREDNTSAGCGGGTFGGFAGSDVSGPPPRGESERGAPTEPAPTGMQWKPIETDEGCGRSGLSWVLVDEVCGDGEGMSDPHSLETPMFRDGAIVGNHLLTVDATHLWSLDLASPGAPARKALVTGLGQPLAVAARGTDLLVAAGLDGLVVVDALDPSAPRRSAGLTLPAPAFDLALDQGEAFVAIGAAGLAVANVAGAAPTLARTIAVPGSLSAGVALDEDHAYVAGCTTFSIVDRKTGALKSQQWIPAFSGPRLVAPAKDVALVGSVAFVAAGTLGAVTIDVSNPAAPQVLGSCRVDDPSFYASGVRAEGTNVFVAGGEWGVLRIDTSNPASACTLMAAAPPPPTTPPGDCSSKPPWEVVPWERVWAPPPPAKDPIQVLPAGDRVYAFGDARRIGVRAVDVRSSGPSLELLTRYDEPRTLLAIAARPGRVVAAGPKGGVFALAGDGALVRTPSPEDAILAEASSVVLADDGRWIAVTGTALRIEGREAPIELGFSPVALAARGTEVVVGSPSGFVTYNLTGSLVRVDATPNAHLPIAVAADPSAIWFAAPEWPTTGKLAVPIGSSAHPFPGGVLPHEVFDDEDAMDLGLWRVRVPRRHLAASARGLVEIAGLGARAGLALHASSGARRVALPALTYAGLATDGDRAYAIAIDRGLYKSYLVTVDIASALPRVTSIEAFTGAASGVATASGRVFVADADGAIRTYAVSGQAVHPASILRVEVTP